MTHAERAFAELVRLLGIKRASAILARVKREAVNDERAEPTEEDEREAKEIMRRLGNVA